MRTIGITSALLAGLSYIDGVQAFTYRGVNAGAWLVTEPWMLGILYNDTKAVDEWHLCSMLGKDQCLKTLDNHWNTFYTRDDFVDIKNAGLSMSNYPYLIRAVQWAKELGLKIFIDMHGVPGSQNGWEESGLVGPIAFLTNQTNQDRTLKVLKNLTEEFSKPEYGGTVTNIELLNEPLYGYADLVAFYKQGASTMVAAGSNSSGINITVSDGFFNPHTWRNYDPWNPAATSPAKNVTVDTHQFWAFPPLTSLSGPEIIDYVCNFSQAQLKASADLGTPPVLVGEWSLSTGVTANSTQDAYYDVAKRTFFRELFEAQAMAFAPNAPGQPSIGWFFWSWKTEYDIDAWSYRKGVQQGYIPSNVSDFSTYEFPMRSDGCLDRNHNYTAPVLATASGTSSSVPAITGSNSGSNTGSTTSSAASASSTKPSSATRFGVQGWVAVASVMILSVVLA
ncbi:hypothetical protein AMS68_007054 [Peltaster fructicola]|uniref:Glycoside hydrolase family 5 domain-containing protein n=1 Tax=Peltaster fructicola TaxID=286661 RepID=A0A6H0Y3F1_9PEZI|nr:hypothetical protein AMS68_007054 [Peltaster fructicola]